MTMPRQMVENAALARDVPRPSLIQNGGFEQWHYGVGPITAQSAQIADKWFLYLQGTSTFSVARDAVNVAAASRYAAAVTYVHNQFSTIYQQLYLEGAGADTLGVTYQLRGKTVTFSAWVKCNTPNAVRIAINAGPGDVTSAFHPGDNTWQMLSVSTTWAAASVAAVNANVSFRFEASCTAYLDDATFVIGSVPADYVPAIAVPDAVPNERLASDVARANQLINGGFEVWQRGNGPFTGPSGSNTADRWTVWAGGGISVSRDTANADNSVACAVVTTTGPGGFVYQNLISTTEGFQLRGKIISFSARVKTSVVNGLRLLVADATAGVNTYSGYHPGNGQYATLTVTLPVPASPTSTNFQVQFVFDLAGTYYLDNAMAVVGSVPADFVPVLTADEVARCQRYYQRLWMSVRWASVNAAISAEPMLPMRAVMPVTPSVTVTPGSRLNIASAAPRGITTEYVNLSYAPTAGANADTYALADLWALEAFP